jgi:hypothetical protein
VTRHQTAWLLIAIGLAMMAAAGALGLAERSPALQVGFVIGGTEIVALGAVFPHLKAFVKLRGLEVEVKDVQRRLDLVERFISKPGTQGAR